MSELDTTPGPWTAFHAGSEDKWVIRAVYVDDHGRRCTAFPATVQCGSQPNEANARLIATAPEMYEALKRLTKDIDPRDLGNHYHEDWKFALAAMSKARGETP